MVFYPYVFLVCGILTALEGGCPAGFSLSLSDPEGTVSRRQKFKKKKKKTDKKRRKK
jgi:hypothetical protein